MSEKCKYCDYISKCSRFCEYNSIMCLMYRSFPKIVDKTYEELEKENKELKNSLEQYQKQLNKENLQCSKYAIEINDLKEQLEESCPMYMDKGYKLAERKYEDRQKEFIEWLEDSVRTLEMLDKTFTLKNYKNEIRIYKEILSKYNETLGGSNG